MVGAGVRADLEHAVHVQEKHIHRFSGHHVDHQGFAGSAGLGLGEDLPRPNAVQNGGIAPQVVVFDQDAAGQHHAQGRDDISSAADHFAFGKNAAAPHQGRTASSLSPGGWCRGKGLFSIS